MKLIQGEIDVLKDISPKEFLEKYIIPRKPVILTQYTKNWSALSKWNIEYFEQYSSTTKFISVLEKGLSKPPNKEKKMNFGEFLKFVVKNEKEIGIDTIYLQQSPIQNFPGIEKDYKMPNFFSESKESFLGENTVFIGSGNTRTSLHYDRPLVDNLFCQIQGRKLFKLWKPSQGNYFYPYSFETRYSHVSKIQELDEIDFEKFPNFKKSEIESEMILESGDLLYIPKGYWHQVTHLQEISISMNFWYF